MKITRKELRRLIAEVAVTLSDEEVSAAKKKLEDEGGAAGPEMVAQVVKDTEDGDPDVTDEDVLKALRAKEPDIKFHSSGDVIDAGGLAERKKRKKKKKTKSKKRGYLYPYVYGHHDHDFHNYGYDVSDGGFDGAGDGGGGE